VRASYRNKCERKHWTIDLIKTKIYIWQPAVIQSRQFAICAFTHKHHTTHTHTHTHTLSTSCRRDCQRPSELLMRIFRPHPHVCSTTRITVDGSSKRKLTALKSRSGATCTHGAPRRFKLLLLVLANEFIKNHRRKLEDRVGEERERGNRALIRHG
jgi:hypothetical protein